MNTTHGNMPPGRRPGWVRRRWLPLVGLILALCAVSVVVYKRWLDQLDKGKDIPVFTAKRGPLTISIVDNGTIQNRDLVIIRSEVEGRTTIQKLIPEGTQVKVGDELVQLDASPLEDAATQQQITVVNADAAYVRAREDKAVTLSQGESDVAKAELAYRFAQLDLKKYIEGEYPNQLQQAQSEITIAAEELQRASDELTWSGQLAAEGYITQTELLGDELAMKRSSIKLELAETDLRLLEQFTHQRQLEQLTSDVEQTRKALERSTHKATADNVQASAQLAAKEAELERQQAKLTKIDEQIVKCTITAPIDGMVVYATTGMGGRRPWHVDPLDVQQEVREMQELIHLPTSSSMMVEVSVPESSIRRIKKDLPVRISVEAVPEKQFFGRVGKIGLLPVSDFWRPGLTNYSVEIYLEGDAEQLRRGMTCRAEIVLAEYDDAVYVPVQAVVRIGNRYAVYVFNNGKSKLRYVKVGLDNNRMIHVLDGLTKGQQVLLNPPLQPSVAPEGGEDEGPTTDTEDEPAQQDEAKQTPKLDFETLKDMTAEQRLAAFADLTPEQRRDFFAELTPEQHKAIKDMMPQTGGGQRHRPGGDQ